MKQNVLGFDVAMNDITVMHEFNCVADLTDHSSDFLFRKTALFFERRVYIASAAWFQDQIKVILVAEKGIKLNNVGMIKIALNFDLSNELIDETGFSFKYFFGDFLERTNELHLFMNCKVDCTELTLLEIFKYLEILDCRLFVFVSWVKRTAKSS